jgi:hypothetical protein
VEYYSAGYVPTNTKLATVYTPVPEPQAALNFAENANIAINETLIVQGVNGYIKGTTNVDLGHLLVLIVVDRDASGKPIVRAVNGYGPNNTIPGIPLDTVVSRAGRAASELQIRTDIFNFVPTKDNQFLQKFIMEVEASTFFEMADKEVRWSISDINERAMSEYRREQNNTFWLGKKDVQKIKNKYNRKAEDTYFTEGLWHMAGGDFSFLGVSPTPSTLVDLMRIAFDAPSASDKKLLMCGSDFLAEIEKIQYDLTSVIHPGTKGQIFGLTVKSILSDFGELLVFHDKSFKEIGMADKAFILDPDYLKRWTMGWRVIPLNNVENGEADSKSIIATETCGLTLKNAGGHLRVTLA